MVDVSVLHTSLSFSIILLQLQLFTLFVQMFISLFHLIS